MKTLITTGILVFIINTATSQSAPVQASPSNLNAPATAQPVPNAMKTEKSAPTHKPEIVLPSTEKPPIYPGAEVHAVETQRNLIFPASPPAPTQPAQTQPLTPVESTNTLNPTQPKREAASRENPVTDIQNGVRPVNAANVIVNPGTLQVQNIASPAAHAPAKVEFTNIRTATVTSKADIAGRLDGTSDQKKVVAEPVGKTVVKRKAAAGVKKVKPDK